MTTIRGATGTLAYADDGPRDAAPVIAIHGLPGSVRDFRHLVPVLPDLRLVRVELPGYGGSDWHPEGDSFDARARAVLEIADHLGLARFVALGHSMGGGTALVLGAEHPGRVRGLLLVSSVALRPHRGLGLPLPVFRGLSLAHRIPGLGHLLMPVSRMQYRRRRFAEADTMTREDYARQLAAIGRTDFARLRRVVHGPLPPVAIAFADDDPLVEPAVSEELVRALPSARVLRFPSGGHNLQKTQAAALAEALRDLAQA